MRTAADFAPPREWNQADDWFGTLGVARILVPHRDEQRDRGPMRLVS